MCSCAFNHGILTRSMLICFKENALSQSTFAITALYKITNCDARDPFVCWIYLRRSTYTYMMTWSNGNIFRVTGPLCGEFTGLGEFPTQRPVTRSFDVFFDLRLNKQLCKQPWGWWFETPSWSLWRHCNEIFLFVISASGWRQWSIIIHSEYNAIFVTVIGDFIVY